MAKLVDAHDSGSCGEIHGGSTPPIDIFKHKKAGYKARFLNLNHKIKFQIDL